MSAGTPGGPAERPGPKWTSGGLVNFGLDKQKGSPALLLGRSAGVAAAMLVFILLLGPLLAPYGAVVLGVAVVALAVAGRFLGGWTVLLIKRLGRGRG